MTTKEFLQQAYKLDRQIQSKHEQIRFLKDRATRATSTVTALRTSGTDVHSNLEDSVVKYTDLQHELANDLAAFYQRRREIAQVISQVEDVDLRVLLEYRYLSFLKWEEIAVRMGCGWRNVHYKHQKALSTISLYCTHYL